MSKRVLVISTSPRKDSNSDALAEEFAKGAREAGHEVEESQPDWERTFSFVAVAWPARRRIAA